MEDIWCRRNTLKKQYTYFKQNSKIASRIDFWFCEKTLDPYISKISIAPAIKTDHASVQCTLQTSAVKRGNGTWKLNKSILESKFFDTAFKSFWQKWKLEVANYDSKKNGGKSQNPK